MNWEAVSMWRLFSRFTMYVLVPFALALLAVSCGGDGDGDRTTCTAVVEGNAGNSVVICRDSNGDVVIDDSDPVDNSTHDNPTNEETTTTTTNEAPAT
jgi:hypothetical protein